MDSILEYERKPEEDFCNILGVDELSDVSLNWKINYACVHCFNYCWRDTRYIKETSKTLTASLAVQYSQISVTNISFFVFVRLSR